VDYASQVSLTSKIFVEGESRPHGPLSISWGALVRSLKIKIQSAFID
jgi:hypothetical protein